MKKILFLFSFMCLFSGHLFAQFPAVKILQDIYPLNLFNANYGNELFRNKMVQVSTGSDTTLWFVDIVGNRAFMAQGAPTDSGGIVVTMYPVKGDGGPVTPVTFEDGVHPGDIFAWDSVAMNWVLYPFPINIYTGSGVLTANRTVGGGAHSLTISNVAGLVMASNTTLSMGASSGRSDLYSLFSDLRLTAGDSLIIRARAMSVSDFDGLGMVYGGNYCNPTNARAVPDNDCVKAMIHDSLLTILQLPNGAINQTLRYSATNVLTATSSIYVTSAPKIGLLTTTTPTRYAINENGSMRFGGTSPLHYDFGNANGRLRPNSTLAVRDTSVAGAIRKLTVSLENKSSADHADCELWLTAPGTLAAAQIGFSAMGLESQFKMGVGQAQDNLIMCFGGDTIINTAEVAIGISPNRNVGIHSSPTDNAQLNFAAQTDESDPPPPIQVFAGAVPDSKVEGTMMYIDDVADRLMFVRGAGLYDITLSSQNNANGIVIDFPSAANGVTVSQDIGLFATAGSGCVLGAPPLSQCGGCIFTCQVSAANTVTCYFTNLSGGTIDQGSRAYFPVVFDKGN